MRLLLFALAILLSAAPGLADEADQAAIVDKVASAFEDNYRRLGIVKARLRMEVVNSFELDVPPPQAAPQPLQPGASEARISAPPLTVIDWTAELAGDNQRYDINGPGGREIISADPSAVSHRTFEQNQATIVPWTSPSVQAHLQYDPREAGFMTMAERLTQTIRSRGVASASLVARSLDETIAEFRIANTLGSGSVVIECSSRFNFLPTRVYWLLDDWHITSVTDVTYQHVRSEPAPVWFLESAVRRNSFPHKNKSLDDKEWGQVITIRVTDLKLDASPPPPRDTAATLPVGILVHDQTPQPRAPLPVETRPPYFGAFAILGVVAVAVILVLLVWAMSLRKSASSERG
jgi:hypothetical protein